MIQLYHALLGRLGVTEFALELNSIGCRECRPAYLERLRAWLDANLDRLDAPTREKAATSPLRIFDNLDAKPPAVQDALREAPTIGDSLCDACREHFAVVRRDLDASTSSTRSSPRSSAGSTTTRGPPGSSSARNPDAAARTTMAAVPDDADQGDRFRSVQRQ